jgi:uncharacterized lipoprotein YmbA
MKKFSLIQKFVFVCIVFTLHSCSSTPAPETHYFVLNPASTSTLNTKNATTPILIEPIRLAKYLDQAGIVLQTDTHEIVVANYHRWGEPLKSNLHRYILKTLTAHSNRNYVDKTQASYSAAQTLTITINEFNGTTNGKALLSGNWNLEKIGSDENLTNHAFQYKAELKTSGYPELVNQLAILLDQLCSDIINITSE